MFKKSNYVNGVDVSKLLAHEPDEDIFQEVVMINVFNHRRFFSVRRDIGLPQKDDVDGVVLDFLNGEYGYFRTIGGTITNNEIKEIYKVCFHIYDISQKPVKAYILCENETKIECDGEINDGELDYGEIKIILSMIKGHHGEEIIDRLEKKLDNGEKFDVCDSTDHILLPYVGYKNKKVFEMKFEKYMDKCRNIK